jgi:hypothetical protein
MDEQDERDGRNKRKRLNMESGLLLHENLNERVEQSLAAFSDVMNKLEEPQIEGKAFLRYSTMGSKPRTEQ